MQRRQFGRMLAACAAAPLAACVGAPYYAQPLPGQQRFELPSDVLFDFGSATLRRAASANLNEILGRIRAVIPYPAIQVVGHTDSIGTDAANDQLSLRRAESVRQWLIGAGIPPSVITVEGLGKRQPIAPNAMPNGTDNPEGRQRNRRVELLARPA